ncbi:MAG: tetratricopeptide repeat protein, partial [Tepidisphaeraceae bacterium]
MDDAGNQIETIFAEAIRQPNAEKRAAYLAGVCGNDDHLRSRVEALLEAHDQAGSFMMPAEARAEASTFAVAGGPLDSDANPAARVCHTSGGSDTEKPGTLIAGRYKLLEALGEGGMGTVWVAEQTKPVRRKVAVKLIKAGMDSRSVLARFEAERQALAMMDHPNIAKVLDGGLTDAGRPYFVMEYVKGVPITEYCDATRLNVAQRLELFAQVCRAVQHAHQKGIIHRDLKPSNILVAPYDDKPVPKVIDFGLAKAMHQSLTDMTLHTAHEIVLGTPLYMSPEQAQLNNLDVDTRSDIYSLGVLLYELLTGTTPVEKQRLKEAAWDEVRRIIREEQPPLPSTRLSSARTLPSLAAGRQMEPAKLTRLVRGDLDWIVMKALEKERNRRYETANGLAMDIQRYLTGEPVLAAPPSMRYRLGKFARKHRAALSAAAAIALLLVAGVTVSTWQAVLATRAESVARLSKRDAEARQAEAERQTIRAEAGEKLASERLILVGAEKKKAEEEKQIAQSVRDFLQNKLLGQADAWAQANALLRTGGLSAEAKENPTIRELLDRAARELVPERIDANFPNQPLIQAEILNTVGETYRGVGEYERAIGFLQRSTALFRQHLGADDPRTLTSMNNLAMAYHAAGKLDLALPIYGETLKLLKAKFGFDHPDTLTSMNNLAGAYQDAGKLDLALPLYEETLKFRKTKASADNPALFTSMNNLAMAYLAAGRLNLALPLFEETARLMKAKLGAEHPDTLTSMNNLANAYLAAGKLDLALPLFEETLKLSKSKLGPDHPSTLISMNSLAQAYGESRKPDLAIPLLEETLRLRKMKLGPDHPSTLKSMNNLANAYNTSGRLDLALPLYEETLKLSRSKLGPEHPETLTSMNNLANAYRQSGKLDLAIPLSEETLRVMRSKLGPDHPSTLISMNNLANAYTVTGKFELALPLYEETLKLQQAKLGPDHPDALTSMSNLAVTYWRAKQLDKSIPLFEETLKRREAKLGRDHPDTLHTAANLGVNYKDAGRLGEALPLLEEGYRAGKRFPGLRWVCSSLLDGYVQAGKTEPAVALVKELLAESRMRLPGEGPELAGQLASLGRSLLQAKAFTEAESLLQECLAIREKTQPDEWTTFNTRSMLGGALSDQKKYAEAEPLLLAGYQGLKQRESKLPPPGKVRLAEALERLITLYESRGGDGDAETAAKYRKLV